jgi:hypothetical protein
MKHWCIISRALVLVSFAAFPLVGCDSSTGPSGGTGGHSASGGTVGSGGSAGSGGSVGTGGGSGGAGTGGSVGTGGVVGSGGAGTGGKTGSGGMAGAGGVSITAGATGSGGKIGSGGQPGSGGRPGTGGMSGTGGTSAAGGSTGTGGTTAPGGATGAGGATAKGGSTGSGGTTGTGGVTGTGGTTAKGGATGAGGMTGAGGTTAPPTGANSVAYIGCSMAYNIGSGNKRVGNGVMWNSDSYQTSAMVVQNWTSSTSSSWTLFDQKMQSIGGKDTVKAVMVQICIFSSRATDDEVKSMIKSAKAHTNPGTHIYLVGQPQYEAGHECSLAGTGGAQWTDDEAKKIAADSSVNQDVTYLGQFILNSTNGEVSSDSCHATTKGEDAMALQANAFFPK